MKYLLFILCFSFYSCAISQGGSASKRATELYRQAMLDKGIGNFSNAILLLNSATENDAAYTDAHFLKGVILLKNLKKPQEALVSFSRVFELNSNYNPLLHVYMADCNFLLGNFAESKKQYTLFLSDKSISKTNAALAEQRILNCDFCLTHPTSEHAAKAKNLGKNINTTAAEYFPALTADGMQLVFTRTDKLGKVPDENIYSSTKNGNDWSVATLLSGNTTTPENEGAHCITQDGMRIIFTACNRPNNVGGCDLYIAKKTGDTWSTPDNLGSTINSPAWETQPSISADSKSIYFVSSRAGGFGGSDIYVTTIGLDGKFGKPRNLGPTINTAYDEEKPFIHPDNKTLYFVSNGLAGYGGKDVFVTRKLQDTTWETPINLGETINTNEDEMGISVSADGKEMYFSSNKAGGFGDQDIYSLSVPTAAKPIPVSYVKGDIVNKATKEKLAAKISVIDLSTNQVIQQTNSDATNGHFLVCLPSGKRYAFYVEKTGFLFSSSFYEVQHAVGNNVHIELQPIQSGERITLNNLFFETNAFNLKPESETELQKMFQFLATNPTLKVEISGHTDNSGIEKNNLILSEKRAKAVYDYLVSKNISATRLTYKGYGASKPVAENSTPEGKAKNRRTELLVL